MITIIPTAHISSRSVEEVQQKILELKPQVVAVELCRRRYEGLVGEKESRDIPIYEIIKSGNMTFFMVNAVLSLFQRKLGEEVGIKPGKEMLTAVETAKSMGIDFAFIDRDIKTTLSRAFSTGFIEKFRVLKYAFLSIFSDADEISEMDIEEMKKEENLNKIISDFKETAPNLYKVLVDERDAYMARNILELSKRYENVLVVVGAGHKAGIEQYLNSPEALPDMSSLTQVKGNLFLSSLKYLFPLLILFGFAVGIARGVNVKGGILLWFVYNGIPTFIGVIVARGSIISALAGMLAAPFTSLNPFIAAGWVAALVELKIRKVTVGDVKSLMKITSYRELCNNNAFRVLLVGAFANIGSSIGTLVFIPKVLLPMMQGA